MTKKIYTVEEAKAYVAIHRKAIMQSYRDSREVPDFMRHSALGAKMEEVWQAGCWMNNMLRDETEATQEEIRDIGFVHGQHSVFGDPWKWGVNLLNEFVERGSISYKPGIELAAHICDENLGPGLAMSS